MLKDNTIYIILNSNNINHYKNKGYDLESLKTDKKGIKRISRGTQLEVSVFDLPENSTAQIAIICDYCGKEVLKQYREYLNSNMKGIIKKDCCGNDECLVKKRNESNLITYGCENVFQNKEINEKIKDIMIQKYGVEHVSQIKEVKEKCKQSMLLKYGVEHAAQNQEIKEKTKIINLEKYGVEHYSKTDDFKEKVKSTCLIRYGVTHVMKIEEVKNKSISESLKTRYKNKSGVASKQQIYLCNLLGGELNFPIGNCLLDIAFLKEKIYVEYDGSGHDLRVKMGDITREEFLQKEINRYYFLRNHGWKLIRFISKNDFIPNDNLIIDVFNISKEYLNSGHSWIKFDFNDYFIECSQFQTVYNL